MDFRDLIEEELKKKEQERQIEQQKRQITQEISIANEQRKNNILPTRRERSNNEILPRASERRTYLVREKKKLSKEVSEKNKAKDNSKQDSKAEKTSNMPPKASNSIVEAPMIGPTINQNDIKDYSMSNNIVEKTPIKHIDTSRLGTEEDIRAEIEARKIEENISKGNYNPAISHVLNNLLEGAKSGIAGIGNAVLIPVAGGLKKYEDIIEQAGLINEENNTLNSASEALLDASDYLEKESTQLSKVNSNINNGVLRTAGSVTNALGNMLPSIMANFVVPGSGLITTGISAGGRSAQETINEDRDNIGEAITTGVLKGGLEALTEKITGGNILSKGTSLDNLVAKGISSKVKSNVGQMLLSKGYEFGGEIAEEIISDTGGNLVDKIVNGKDMPSLKEWWENSGETAKTTFLTTAVLQALGLGGGTYNDVKQLNLNKQQEAEAQSWISEAENIIKNTSGEQNNQRRDLINQNNIARQMNEEALPVNNEQFRYTNRAYEESAKKYNIDTNNETVKSINRVAQERGINVKYDADLFDNTNTNAIWRSNADGTREVILNPNADTNKTLESVITHELTHDLEGTNEYSELRDLILNYNENKTDYAEARKSLEELYSKVYDRNSIEFETLVDNEAVADILGNKLGNQEFINNLTTEKPTLGKRIYNWVVDKLNKINKATGYKSEKIFWTDVKNKFENAYKQDYKRSNVKTKYSIQTDNNGNRYIKVDTDQNIFEGIDRKDYSKIAKMYIKDYLMGETQLSENDIAIIDRRSANKYTNPGKKQQNFDKKMQLTPELKNVLKIAQKDNIASPTKDTSKYQNWEYYKFKFELNGKKFEGTINIGIDSNGNRHFYEINKIKELDDISGTSLNRSSSSSINNSITPQKEDVNTTTKYSMQEPKNNTWQTYLDKNYKNTGTGRTVQDVKIAPIAKIELNKVAKNQETLYNNHESESGMNEQIQQSRLLESNNGLSRFSKENINQENRKYTRTEFEDWEKSIKPITESKLSNEQRQIKEDFKRQYNKDIVFFDGKNNKKGYSAGASYTDSKRINIDINQAKEFGTNKIIYHEVMESNILHNLESNRDIIEPALQKIINDPNFEKQKTKFWQGQDGAIPNDYLIAKELLCDRYAEMKTGETWDYDNVLSQETNMTIDFAIENFEKQLMNSSNKLENNIVEKNKTLNPVEISNLNREDANTTPELKNKTYEKGNKQSSFLSNITTDAKFLNEDLRQVMSKDENIQYYKGITNKETLEKAYNKLQEKGQEETIRWHSNESQNATAEDVAEGWILLKQYQDKGDYQSAVEVAKKMREIGTQAGQTVQAYNILSRLTPEGMFYYVQSELDEAYSKMVEGKSRKWIEENQPKFNLTPEETQFILDTMQEVSKMPDGYDKKVKLAEIQKMYTDKIPATAGQSVKAWMRISMLFNPKTQVRNVMGNTVIMPVNMFSDSVSAGIDKLISKRTGIRTTGNTNIKSYAKGFGKGFYESYNDFKKGVNTRNVAGNRFEVTEGKSFNNKGIGKALNRVDNLLSFMLDAGDRGFYEASFTNSINNQLVLNNTTEVTQDMIDIATTEALQRTWQDNNNYTKAVLGIRRILNNVNVKGYGLGDVLIPFAKTPANLTKAIVDYSPVGLVKTLTADAKKFSNSLQNGQYTSQLQHQFVQNLGKATAGSFLFVLGYALAQAGVITGEADEDKDVKNFMKNSLGIGSYSIKIGDKSFSYDWAQPVATPFAIMSNYVKYSKDNPDAGVIDKAINAMNIGTEQLLEQSFMESLNTVLNGSGSTLENLSQSVLELPSRAIPTFSKQIADMVDDTQRTSFEYNKPIQSALNSMLSKIPFASKTLPSARDTLGNEIKKYGGNNNVWNVMINPANTNKGQLSKAGKEIYDVYMQTGDTTIFPRTAPYYINSNNEKIEMTGQQRSEFQKISGQYVEKNLTNLLESDTYKKLNDEKKAELISEIVSDSYSKAKYDVLEIDSKEYEKLRNVFRDVSEKTYYDYKIKTQDLKKDSEKIEAIVNSNYSNKEKQALYEKTLLSDSDKKYPIIKEAGINIQEYLKYKLQDFSADKKDDGTVSGKSISGSSKQKKYNYIMSMENVSNTQKLILFALEYEPSSNNEKQRIINFVTNLNKSNEEKLEIIGQFKGVTVYKNGTFTY